MYLALSVTSRNSNEIAGIGFALFWMKQIARMVLSLTRREIAEIKTQAGESKQQTASSKQQTTNSQAGGIRGS